MTEIKELVGKLVAMSVKDEECPFCDVEEPPPGDGHKVLKNDAQKLRGSIGAEPNWTFQLPHKWRETGPVRDSYLTEINGYRCARVSANAHHIIPGNESLWPTRSLLKWMAPVVEMTKSGQPTKRKPRTKEPTPQTTISIGERKNRNGDTVYTKTTTQTITTSHNITGKIKWDVNDAENGIYLPSGNAVLPKSELDQIVGIRASKSRREYAKLAMGASGHCFHERHVDYSREVRSYLQEISLAIEEKYEKCSNGEQGCESVPGDPKPAPEQLTDILNNLSDMIRGYLEGERFSEPWYTSRIALDR